MHEYLLRDLTHAVTQDRRRDAHRHQLASEARAITHRGRVGFAARLLAHLRHRPVIEAGRLDVPRPPAAVPGRPVRSGLDPSRAA